MYIKGADASRYVPSVRGHKRAARSLGGMRSGASFIDWKDVYVDTREAARKARIRSYIDYIACEKCKGKIDLHRGTGVTHVAGVACCPTCADKE